LTITFIVIAGTTTVDGTNCGGVCGRGPVDRPTVAGLRRAMRPLILGSISASSSTTSLSANAPSDTAGNFDRCWIKYLLHVSAREATNVMNLEPGNAEFSGAHEGQYLLDDAI